MLVFPQKLSASRPVSGFLSKYVALLDMCLRAGDVLIVLVAAVLATRWRFGVWVQPEGYPTGVVRAALLTVIVFHAFNLYRSWRGAPIWAEALRLSMAWCTVTLALLIINWALKLSGSYSRLWMACWFFTALALFLASRLGVRGLLALIRMRGMDFRTVVLVGATEVGQKVLHAVRARPWMGLSVSGYVATPYDQLAYNEDIPCLGHLDSYLREAVRNPPDQLWIALPLRAEPEIKALLEVTDDLPIEVRLVPDFFGYELINHHAGSVAGVPIITLRGNRVEAHARVAKAIEDRVLALLLLLVLSLPMLLIAVAVKLTSPGPVFFRQKRHGQAGREIEVWKFRSMRMHSEAADTVTQARRNDPRITWVGRILRSTSLDELPQLINVLQGHMSIVGPRPHAVQHNHTYSERLRGYMQRHCVKPGLTGLAQVRGFRGETDTLEKMARRVDCDIDYINRWSVWLDLKIILLTPFALLKRTNAY